MYKIVFSNSSLKTLKRIPSKTQKTILLKLERLKVNPYQVNNNVKKLQGMEAYRLRVGNYRIIYEVENTILKIFIIDIDTRGGIYK